jgi:hypothetical protein
MSLWPPRDRPWLAHSAHTARASGRRWPPGVAEALRVPGEAPARGRGRHDTSIPIKPPAGPRRVATVGRAANRSPHGEVAESEAFMINGTQHMAPLDLPH